VFGTEAWMAKIKLKQQMWNCSDFLRKYGDWWNRKTRPHYGQS
jgi:hypothetical protein